MQELEFYKYVNDVSLLVISPNGKLNRLYCPFVVKYKGADLIGTIPQKLYSVEKIDLHCENKIYYYINGQKYSHSKFTIVKK
jgi:hypothetical protein